MKPCHWGILSKIAQLALSTEVVKMPIQIVEPPTRAIKARDVVCREEQSIQASTHSPQAEHSPLRLHNN
jgi:hypothetical protein